ncbi:MAG: glycoside hydrolase family 9 protein [Bryobacterales bacterium]|nr:glycoside hydrolase family 9 protein [Bryobacterales bacterium]
MLSRVWMGGPLCTAWVCVLAAFPGMAQEARRPMTAAFEEGAAYRLLQKPVIESRLLDDMENPATWSFNGKGEMTFTRERAVDGRQSLRIQTVAGPTHEGGRRWISAYAARAFPDEDWTRFNRLSFWVYADVPGFPAVALTAAVKGKSSITGYNPFGREALHYFNVENGRWTRVVWEIAHLPREAMSSFTIQYIMKGRLEDASGRVVIDVDRLELQRVEPDHYEGWSVAPGRIAFSHAGYQSGAVKRAMASDLDAAVFELVRLDTGQAILSKPLEAVQTPLGRFQVMDFSEVRRPGTYLLRAGGRQTRPFRIGDDVWRDSLRKALNFFFAERCGMEIPGVHGVCHRDWQAVRGDKRIVMNGGWHDAGDLSQGTVNTSEAAYAMLSLAARLQTSGEDPELLARVLDEAHWGIRWLLKTTFGEGYRVSFSGQSHWSDGILGNEDDTVVQAANSPYENFLTVSALSLAARVWKEIDPDLSSHCLRVAREDWRAAVEALDAPSRNRLASPIDIASSGALASIELFLSTGDEPYAAKARALGGTVLECQRRTFLAGSQPALTGFFYTSPAQDRILHFHHRGHEQTPLVALARLIETFPDDANWMRWYSAMVLHSEYLKTAAAFNRPYEMLAASVYQEDEYLKAAENLRESYRNQILNGIAVAPGYRLRRFPVWSNMRGNHGTLLSQAKALSTAGQLRGDLESVSLAQKQLEWVIGRNPFAQSTMYGEGYDFPPLYTISSGDLVGALPVGIETRGDNDVPYWPGSISHVYREVWVHPVSRWIWLMRDLAGPARISGHAAPDAGAVTLKDLATGEEIMINPETGSGAFHASVPQGRYRVRSRSGEKTMVLLPGASGYADLRPGRAFELSMTAVTDKDGQVAIRVTPKGQGMHRLSLRVDNLAAPVPDAVADFAAGKPVEWKARMKALDTPWVAVVVCDGDVTQRQEIMGRLPAGGTAAPANR